MKRTEDSLRDCWDNIKCTNIQIIMVPYIERKWKDSQFNICCKTGFVLVDSFTFCLSEKITLAIYFFFIQIVKLSVLFLWKILLLASVLFHLLKRLSLPHCIFLLPLSNIRYPQVLGSISGLYILFPWTMFLFLCQYHTFLMIIPLQHNLKSVKLIPPAPFFFLRLLWLFRVFNITICIVNFFFL